jgi:hypothetical protein
MRDPGSHRAGKFRCHAITHKVCSQQNLISCRPISVDVKLISWGFVLPCSGCKCVDITRGSNHASNTWRARQDLRGRILASEYLLQCLCSGSQLGGTLTLRIAQLICSAAYACFFERRWSYLVQVLGGRPLERRAGMHGLCIAIATNLFILMHAGRGPKS